MDNFSLSLIGQQSVRIVSLYKNCSFPFDPFSKVACCPFSGPIAVASLKDSSNDKAFIVKIFTANGEFLSQIEASLLYEIFWTHSQKIVLLSKNGRVLVYTASGNGVTRFQLDSKTEVLNICSAKIFTSNNANMKHPVTGLACLKDSGHFFAVNNVESAQSWRIPDVASRNAIPTVWTMLPTDDVPLLVWYTSGNGFKMAGQGKSVTPRAADWMRTKGDYTEMVLSVDMKSVCLSHDSGVIQIVKLDLSTELFCLDVSNLNINKNAMRILWSKRDQIMLRAGQNKIICVNKSSESTEFAFHSEVHTCPEIDGLNVFDKATADTIVPISTSMRNVLRLDSKESSAYLYEAAVKYKAKDPMANDYVIQIGNNLPNAIRDCWTAALEARLAEEENNLFSAAVFGQNLQKTNRSSDRIDFAQHCNHLRILRFLHKRGIPMSFAQLKVIGIDGVIDRLIEIRLYAAADIIAQQASFDARKRIVAHWALDAIQNVNAGLTDEVELGDKIIARFAEQKHVSFSATAEEAHKKSLFGLCDRLLELEEDVVQQVTTLLKIKQLDRALKKSAKSKDPDLLFMVIRQLKVSQNNKDLELMLQKIPHVFEMYKSMTQDENPDRLMSLYKQSDDFRQQALYHIASLPNLNLFDVTELSKSIDSAVEALDGASAPQLATLMRQHKILVLGNSQLEAQNSTSLLDKNLRETIMWAAAKQPSLVGKLSKQYKLNDKQCWKWVVDGLSSAGEWDRLEHFNHENKSPYGYLPLIRVYIKYGQKERALKLISKIPPADQITAYELIGDVKKAAELALAKQDMNQLVQLRLRYPTESAEFSTVSKYIDKAQAQSTG